ncbi:MAG TPA: type II toxin-antitoxin system RelB/DinJ family antitoxin [Clostridiaceae bacterium]|jgi:DNA-damage-inducible protein J|nr:type II toxin-antitoxin system RelB/DinJ family antitoxin [Clostridiaceae bacterium]
MGTTNINVRVDSEVKQKAEAIFNELGLNMSTAMNMFLRYSIRYGGIPFDLRLDLSNEETQAAIDDVNKNRLIYILYAYIFCVKLLSKI